MNPSEKRPLYVPYGGPTLLEMPLLNKGSAFSNDERVNFNLIGLLPQQVETIDEQLARAYRFQKPLIRRRDELTDWHGDVHGDEALLTVVENARPTVLIGVAGRSGLFTETIVKRMHQHCAEPFIMPLSNPTSRAEATPQDILTWTDGTALVATGSPFDAVVIGGRTVPIAQCNNAYIFPGVGLGVIATNAWQVTDEMLMAASRALAENSPLAHSDTGALLPPLSEVCELSRAIAFAVAKQAQDDGVALASSDEAIRAAVARQFWVPRYRRYRRAAF